MMNGAVSPALPRLAQMSAAPPPDLATVAAFYDLEHKRAVHSRAVVRALAFDPTGKFIAAATDLPSLSFLSTQPRPRRASSGHGSVTSGYSSGGECEGGGSSGGGGGGGGGGCGGSDALVTYDLEMLSTKHTSQPSSIPMAVTSTPTLLRSTGDDLFVAAAHVCGRAKWTDLLHAPLSRQSPFKMVRTGSRALVAMEKLPDGDGIVAASRDGALLTVDVRADAAACARAARPVGMLGRTGRAVSLACCDALPHQVFAACVDGQVRQYDLRRASDVVRTLDDRDMDGAPRGAAAAAHVTVTADGRYVGVACGTTLDLVHVGSGRVATRVATGMRARCAVGVGAAVYVGGDATGASDADAGPAGPGTDTVVVGSDTDTATAAAAAAEEEEEEEGEVVVDPVTSSSLPAPPPGRRLCGFDVRGRATGRVAVAAASVVAVAASARPHAMLAAGGLAPAQRLGRAGGQPVDVYVHPPVRSSSLSLAPLPVRG